MAVLRACGYWVYRDFYLLRLPVAVLRACGYWVYAVKRNAKFLALNAFFLRF